MTRVPLRRLLPADVAPLVSLLTRTGVFRPEEVEVARELLESGAERGDASEYLFWVAAAGNGRLLGYSCYGPTPCTEGTYDLYWLAVDPGAQGGGLASNLLGRTEEDAKSRGGRLLVVETEDSPPYGAARAFYEARGFSRAAFVPDFYRPDCGLILYTKRLLDLQGGR